MLPPIPSVVKALAKPVTKGGITFSLLPHKPIRHDWALAQLERVSPRRSWTNAKTGDTVTVMPDAVRIARETAKLTGAPDLPDTGWTEKYLWSDIESTFITLEGFCVGADFAATLTPEENAFKTYWQNRTGVVETDWALFQYLFTGDLYTAIWNAYAESRPTHYAAPAVLSQDTSGDPNA